MIQMRLPRLAIQSLTTMLDQIRKIQTPFRFGKKEMVKSNKRRRKIEAIQGSSLIMRNIFFNCNNRKEKQHKIQYIHMYIYVYVCVYVHIDKS